MGIFDFLKPKPAAPPEPVAPGTLLVVQDVFELQNVGPIAVGIAAAPIAKGQAAVLQSEEAVLPVTISQIEIKGVRSEYCQAGEPVGLVLQNVQFSQIAKGNTIMAA